MPPSVTAVQVTFTELPNETRGPVACASLQAAKDLAEREGVNIYWVESNKSAYFMVPDDKIA